LGIPVNSGSGPGTKNQGEKGGEDKLRANKAEVKDIISACSAAAEELAAARNLIEALEAEKLALAERLETEKQISKLLNMIAEGEKKRAIALEETIAMQKELSAANKRLIEKQGEEIIRLQKKKSTLLKRLGDFLIGAAAALILK
jgi:CRISPR/Cas system-associated endonuclease Cas3-HD